MCRIDQSQITNVLLACLRACFSSLNQGVDFLDSLTESMEFKLQVQFSTGCVAVVKGASTQASNKKGLCQHYKDGPVSESGPTPLTTQRKHSGQAPLFCGRESHPGCHHCTQ